MESTDDGNGTTLGLCVGFLYLRPTPDVAALLRAWQTAMTKLDNETAATGPSAALMRLFRMPQESESFLSGLPPALREVFTFNIGDVTMRLNAV